MKIVPSEFALERMSRIKELKSLLDGHNYSYWILDNPDITDKEYDDLEAEYEQLTGVKYYANHIPGGVSAMFAEVKHAYPVKSLDKINTEEELREELLRLAPGIVMLKYDGLTLVDDNSNATRVIATRGKGVIGEDVTATASQVMPVNGTNGLPVRVEAFLTYDMFRRINIDKVANGEEPYKNMRNAAAGMIRNSDLTRVSGVTYVAYNLMGSGMTELEQLEVLKSLGYNTPPKEHIWHFNKDNIDEIVDLVLNFDEFRSNLPFEIDGLVIKSGRPNAQEHFGETEHHYKNAVAFKFPSQGKWTKLLGIRWTVGRTGKIVPNADIEKVDILSSTVKRASLSNASMLGRKGLCKGCEVFVVKGNDVIPDIVDARGGNPLSSFKEPTECPKCHEGLTRVDGEKKGVYQLYCENPGCGSKTILRVVHMAQKEALGIEGLNEKTAIKMYEDVLIENPEEIFKLTVDEIEELEGFARPSALKLYNAIQSRRKVDFARFLYAGGVPLVGESTSNDIANEFLSYDNMLRDIRNGCIRLRAIPSIGHKIVQSILENGGLWANLRKYVEPIDTKKVKKVDKQLTFVITGTLPEKRPYYEALIKEAGHKASGSVSKKTDYLLLGKNAGGKKEDADACGTKIITTEEELREILGI
jgi:DNA ligase (NAD+)